MGTACDLIAERPSLIVGSAKKTDDDLNHLGQWEPNGRKSHRSVFVFECCLGTDVAVILPMSDEILQAFFAGLYFFTPDKTMYKVKKGVISMQRNVCLKSAEILKEGIFNDELCHDVFDDFALSRNWICADCLFEICLNVNGGARRRLSFNQLWYYLELASGCFDFLSPPMLVGENRIALIGIGSATDGYSLCDFLNLTRKLMGDSEYDGYDCFLYGSFISEGEIDCMLKLQNERDHMFMETDGLGLKISEF